MGEWPWPMVPIALVWALSWLSWLFGPVTSAFGNGNGFPRGQWQGQRQRLQKRPRLAGDPKEPRHVQAHRRAHEALFYTSPFDCHETRSPRASSTARPTKNARSEPTVTQPHILATSWRLPRQEPNTNAHSNNSDSSRCSGNVVHPLIRRLRRAIKPGHRLQQLTRT